MIDGSLPPVPGSCSDESASLSCMYFPKATSDELTSFEVRTGLHLPNEVQSLYLAGSQDGGRQSLRALTLDEMASYTEGLRRFGIPERWQFAPLLDFNDSNPVCVSCCPELDGRIVVVNHDDASELVFSSVAALIAACRGKVPKDASDLAKLGYRSYRHRSNEDVAAGERLIELGVSLPCDDEAHEVERGDALRFGFTLLSDEHVSRVAGFLDDDEYVADDARHWLEACTRPEAAQALAVHKAQRVAFLEHVGQLLRSAGYEVRIDRRLQSVQVLQSGRQLGWLNMPALFAGRNEPDWERQLSSIVESMRARP